MMYCSLRDRVEVHRMDAKDAASVAALLMTSEAMMVERPTKPAATPTPDAGMNY